MTINIISRATYELKTIYIRIMLSLLAITFVLAFSYSTSPFYSTFLWGDSEQFLSIGKLWLSGLIPYRDVFDHKGPLIFLINMLGFAMTGTKTGVCIIQCFCFIITLNMTYNICRLAVKNNIYILFSILTAIFVYIPTYGAGNYVDEYTLCCSSVCVYFLLKYFYAKPETHSPYVSIMYGLAFSACLMTRATNAVVLCCGVFVILIDLIKRKQYKNIFWNGIAFILGGYQ